MSRHRLPLPKGYVIIGFDRPVGAFFCQEWKTGKDAPINEDDCIDLDLFEDHYKRKLPKMLRETLIKEACGDSDTNVCQRWDW